MASRGGGANRTAGGPGTPSRRALAWRRTGRCADPVPLPELPARVPGRKSPRWSAERGPGRTGAWWSRLARATNERVRLSALHPPLVRGAMGLLLPGLPPRLRRPLHRSLGQGRGEQDRRTRAHERAAGTKKTALFDIVSLRPWPTVRFARRDFARSCPGRAKRDPGTHCAISRDGVTLPNAGAAWPVQRKPTKPPSAS